MKTVRFADVVARSGRPETHLTWSAPGKDRVLQQAARRHRVLTVHQRLRGARKDFGAVGIEADEDAQFLVFPKSLRPFTGRRVIAIRYDLLADALSLGAAPRGAKRAPARTPSAAKSSPHPKKASRQQSQPSGKVVPFPSKKTPPFPRRSPKPEKAVVRSPVPQTTPGKTRAPRPAQETQADTRSPDASTLKKQIRLALADLAAGRHRKAERRLRGALAG